MIITIIGSMAFHDRFRATAKSLAKQNHRVHIPDSDEKLMTDGKVPISVKRKAMDVFNEKLKQADVVLVMNYDKNEIPNYIGVNALMEIGMAFILGKPIYLLNPIPDSCRDELEAIEVRVLDGDLSKLVIES